MPALYRSKSVTRSGRFDDNSGCLTSFIEKDNKKVLASGVVQLFISTSSPQLEKWFKSSTGTICFLKDSNRQSTYVFRLYSLMQGQIWEQEVNAPFEYKRKSYFFHYLKTGRFNFGFKFICEDEADRFSSIVSKNSLTTTEEIIINKHDQNQSLIDLFNDKKYSPLTQIEYSQNKSTIKEKKQKSQSNNLNIITTPKLQSSTNNSILASNSPMILNKTPRNIMVSSNRNDAQNFKNGSVPSVSNHSNIINNLNTPSLHSQTLVTNNKDQRSSSETKKKAIDKRDISCPFRCSCKDLNLDEADNKCSKITSPILIVDTNNNKDMINNNIYSTPKANKLQIQNINSSNLVQKYSTIVKRALSSATPNFENRKQFNSKSDCLNNNKNSYKGYDDHFMTENKSKLTNKLIYGSTSSISRSSTSVNGIATTQNGENYKINSTTMTTTLKNTESIAVYSSKANNILNKKDEKAELEIIKDLLIKSNIPINKKLIKLLQEYAFNHFGGDFEIFKKALKSEYEQNKFNSFIAASSAALIEDSFAKKNITKYQTCYPMMNTILPPKNTSSPLKPKEFSGLNTPVNSFTMVTPTTPIKIPTNSQNVNSSDQISFIPANLNYASNVLYTPSSLKHNQSETYSYNCNKQEKESKLKIQQQQNHIEHTPLKTNHTAFNYRESIASKDYTANYSRMQTPSPSRHSHYQLRNNLANNGSITPNSNNTDLSAPSVPPKPPRRSSIKINLM